MRIQCYKCGRGMADMANLFKVDGTWFCDRCMSPEDKKKIDPEVKELTDIICNPQPPKE